MNENKGPDGEIPLQQYVDIQIAEVRRAAELALASGAGQGVTLREYSEALVNALRTQVLAILEEQRRGVEVAEQEREKAAQEQRRGMETAEQEREKAAKALRAELARAIEEGDRNLREHITQQIHQIREALISAEKLDIQRHMTSDQALKSLAREVEIKSDASEQAIAKAEAATERRFESVNEWRGQSLDRENSQREETARLTATFMPREVAEAQINEVRSRMQELSEKLAKLVA